MYVSIELIAAAYHERRRYTIRYYRARGTLAETREVELTGPELDAYFGDSAYAYAEVWLHNWDAGLVPNSLHVFPTGIRREVIKRRLPFRSWFGTGPCSVRYESGDSTYLGQYVIKDHSCCSGHCRPAAS